MVVNTGNNALRKPCRTKTAQVLNPRLLAAFRKGSCRTSVMALLVCFSKLPILERAITPAGSAKCRSKSGSVPVVPVAYMPEAGAQFRQMAKT